MSNIQNILVTVSLTIWFSIVAFELLQNKRYIDSFVQIIIILGMTYVLNQYFGYFNTIQMKGGQEISEVWILIGLYISNIIGILGHHLFVQIKGLQDKGKQPKIRWMPVIKPIIISPLTFLAVLNQLEQISARTNTLQAFVTQCALAFQNGFFWKTVIEQFDAKKENKSKEVI